MSLSARVLNQARPFALLMALITLVAVLAAASSPAQAVPPTGDPQFVQVAGSDYEPAVLGLTAEGEVYSWGASENGLLGQGSSPNPYYSLTPAPVVFPGLAVGDAIAYIAVGSTHALAVTAQGVVYAWGANGAYQLGLGDTTTRYEPTVVPAGSFDSLGADVIVEVSAGGAHTSMARTAGGKVYVWGANGAGQMGNGTTTDVQTPQLRLSEGAVSIAAGYHSSHVVLEDGGIRSWGRNTDGQLGSNNYVNSTTPVVVNPLDGLTDGDKAVTVVAGAAHVLVITEHGRLYSWGDNYFGQLGLNNTAPNRPYPWEVQFPGLDTGETIVHASAGGNTSVAVTSTGRVFTWGLNSVGQLGLGDTTERIAPAQVTTWPGVLDGAGLVYVTAAAPGVVAVSSTGGVYGTAQLGGLVGNATFSQGWPSPSFSTIRLADLAGTVTLSATPRVGEEVSASPSGWRAGAQFSYQWTLDGADIVGAVGSSYTPVAEDEDGTLSVTVTAVAENYGPGTASATGVLVLPPLPPIASVITTASLPSVEAGAMFSETVTATGHPAPTFTADLPDWLVIDPATGELSGYTTVAGTYDVEVTATNPGGADTRQFQIEVTPGDPDHLVLGVSDTMPVVGDTVGVTAHAYDGYDNLIGEVTNVTEFSSSSLDDVVDDNQVTFGSLGPRTITGTALEGITATLDITVAAPPVAPTIITASLPSVEAGAMFSQTVTATGSAPIAFSGVLPGWLVIDPVTGELSGYTEIAGIYDVEVTATNAVGADTRHFVVTVTPGDVDFLVLTASALTVPQGGSVTLTAEGFDEYGNSLGDLTGQVTFTSDVATDVVDGNQITFPTASPHTITGTTGEGATGTVLIEVQAAMADTGADVPGWVVPAALLLVLSGAGALLVVRTRQG